MPSMDYANRPPYDHEHFRGFMRRVQLRMTQLDVNQSELARRIGVNHASVSGWMSGRFTPQLFAVLELPKALQCDGHWLLTGEGTPDKKPVAPAEEQAQGEIAALQGMQRYVEGQLEAVLKRVGKKAKK